MPGLHKTLSRAFKASSAPVAILPKYLLLHLQASREALHFRHARFHLEQEIERVVAISRAKTGERKQNPTSTEMAPPAGKNMAADDVPVAADELEGQDSGHVIVPLKSTKSFHSKSLGEGDKTGVQVRQNPSSQGFPWVAHTFP